MAFKAGIFGGLKFETVDKSRLSETQRLGQAIYGRALTNGFKDL